MEASELASRVVNARDLLKTLRSIRNRELADIGLSRGDVRDATAAPFGDDRSEPLRAETQSVEALSSNS